MVQKSRFEIRRRDYRQELGIEEGKSPSLEVLEEFLRKERLRSQALGKFKRILQAVQIIKGTGTLARIRQKRKRAFRQWRAARKFLNECFGEPVVENSLPIDRSRWKLTTLHSSYHALLQVVRENEAVLASEGWAWNAQIKQFEHIGRTTKSECMGAWLIRGIIDNPNVKNTKELREGLVKLLKPYLPDEWHDTTRKGKISDVLDNHQKLKKNQKGPS